ncbi:MAG: glutamine synthetase family protein [Woeseia sp.]|nr:glutamine synthetase family protein [Woeseia sp.]
MGRDVQTALQQFPELKTLDLLMPDMNGIVRGKRVSSDAAEKALEEGILLPASLYACDVCGDTVPESGLGVATGDRDWECRADLATLRPVPWTNGESAQCLIEMFDSNGAPFLPGPRLRLAEVVRRLHAADLYPTVAVELEFYLVAQRLADDGMPALPRNPSTGQAEGSTQVYSMDDLDDFGPFIERVQHYCAIQSVPASAAVAEYAPGQFEINLHHRDDPLAACDDALYLKRIIKTAARELGYTATFMARPFAEFSGSGMHLHVSVQDKAGNNLFASEAATLRAAVAGLQRSMEESMLIFAPHANSYRRFREHAYVPLSPSWGYNNRTVALRIPAGDAKATRIEHRLPGADANPYLAMAAVLSGILDGLQDRREPDAPIDGNADELCEATLTPNWLYAIRDFDESAWIAQHFGKEFQALFSVIKRAEHEQFRREVSPLEVKWCLRTV